MRRTRDQEIIDFLQEWTAADTLQIAAALCRERGGLRYAQQRLKRLHDAGQVKRWRQGPWQPWIYYTGRQAQLEHRRLITAWHVALLTGPGQILDYHREMVIGPVRADAYHAYLIGRQVHLLLLEVQTEARPPDWGKYRALYTARHKWERIFPEFPAVIVISGRRWTVPEGLPFRAEMLGTEAGEWTKILFDSV